MLFNQAMTELADLNPTYERDGGMFWIYYTVVAHEPETVVEEHQENGEYAHCIDCPYLMRDLNRFGSIDGRRKWATCGKSGERTHVDSTVCEEYYNINQREEEILSDKHESQESNDGCRDQSEQTCRDTRMDRVKGV